ncbi:hypothetical protein [Myxosarcina sp. GI1]|uniref:ribonuclease toxin HepT-like protein n=1 Tax=Myxosarcina sp. GI1 TaxID=1541065 RepID=UPI0035287586
MALDIHGFYSGIERIFEKIAKQIDRNPPAKSEQWHKNLLQQMTVAISQVRDAVISTSNLANLDELGGKLAKALLCVSILITGLSIRFDWSVALQLLTRN